MTVATMIRALPDHGRNDAAGAEPHTAAPSVLAKYPADENEKRQQATGAKYVSEY